MDGRKLNGEENCKSFYKTKIKILTQCPNRALSLGEPTLAVVRPNLEFPGGQGINGNDSQVGCFAVSYVSRELKDSFRFSEKANSKFYSLIYVN